MAVPRQENDPAAPERAGIGQLWALAATRAVPFAIAVALGVRWSPDLRSELALWIWWLLACLCGSFCAHLKSGQRRLRRLSREVAQVFLGLAVGVVGGVAADGGDDDLCLQWRSSLGDRAVELTGTLRGAPRMRSFDQLWSLQAETVRCAAATSWRPLDGDLQVALPLDVDPTLVRAGRRVHLRARVRWSSATHNSRSHTGRSRLLLRVKSPRLIVGVGSRGERRLSTPAAWMHPASGSRLAEADRGGDSPGAAVGRALWLGDSSRLTRDQRDLVRRAGLAHLFSASGLHLALVVGTLAALVGWLPRTAFLPILAGILYTALLGFRTSIVRALVAMGLWSAGRGLGWRGSPGRLWSLSLLLLIAQRPERVAEGGALLSFVAVAGILLALRSLRHVGSAAPADQSRRTPAERALAASFAASIGAQWAVHSLVVRWFGIVPTVGPLLHLVVGPLTAALMMSSLGAALATVLAGSGVGAAPAALLGWAADCLAQALLGLAAAAGHWTRAAHGPRLWWGQGVLLGLGAWLLLTLANRPRTRAPVHPAVLAERRRVTGRASALVALLALLAVGGLAPSGVDRLLASVLAGSAREELLPRSMPVTHRVEFLDVGQGDAAALVSPRGAILVDGGGWASNGVGLRVVLPTLSAIGAADLDAVVLSHGDVDHCRGLLELTRWRPARRLIAAPAPAGLEADSCEGRLRRFYAARTDLLAPGDLLRIAGWILERPRAGIAAARPLDGNDGSLVLVARPAFAAPDSGPDATIGAGPDRCVLFTGDIERGGERSLLRGASDLRCAVLKVPHHGSVSSTTQQLLERVTPRVAVISAGRSNRYGHPHAAVLERLCRRGIAVRRTDRHGRVAVSVAPHLAVASVFDPSPSTCP